MELLKSYKRLNEELSLLLVRQECTLRIGVELSGNEKEEHKLYEEALERAIQNTRLKISNLLK